MGCDYYLETLLSGHGNDSEGTKTDILLSIQLQSCYDTAYDSDSEDDRERQRKRRVPETKCLMTDGTWMISSSAKKDTLR